MTPRFRKAVAELVEIERGYNDIPSDRGGATNFGISLRWYRRAIDPTATAETIRQLTQERAAALYFEHFWTPCGAEALPAEIGEAHFTNYVNMHPREAGRILQRAINRASSAGLAVDGLVGPATVAAAHKAPIVELKRRIVSELSDYYHDLCKANAEFDRDFSNGWFYRAATLFIH